MSRSWRLFIFGFLPFFTTLVPLASGVSVDIATSERCVVAISEALRYLSFAAADSPNAPFIVDECTNRLRTYSAYAAAKVYCSPREIRDGVRLLKRDCEAEGWERIPYADVEPVLTDEYLRRLPVVEFRELNKGVELEEPVLISGDYFRRAYRTNEAWALESWAHRAFGDVAYWYWGAVLLVGTLNKFVQYCLGLPGRSRRYPKQLIRLMAPFGQAHHFVKTHLIIPASVGTYHQRLFYWCSIPTRLETIVISLYYILSFILCTAAHDVFRGNLFWNDTFTQTWRYLSDRTGIMSYANLVMLWLFGGRNNVFLWATGWNFATFNLFHRAIARIATVHAIIHSVGYTVLVIHSGTFALYWPSPWWYMGVVATICMSLLLGFSSIWLRKNHYEMFLLIHITLSIATLVGLFIHTSLFTGEYDHYLWPVVIVWCVDRLARLLRLIYCNIHVRSGQLLPTRSTVSYDKATDLIRLDVVSRNLGVLPQPGFFYYIYQPAKWTGYESHPFTAASWSTMDVVDGPVDPLWPTLPRFSGDKEFVGCKLTFLIRPYDGWTRRLREDCFESPTYTTRATLLLEGAYGDHHKLHQYENVILIAGGTGIAAVLPHIEEHIRRTASASVRGTSISPATTSPTSPLLNSADISPEPKKRPGSDHTTKTKRITVIWAVRQEDLVHDLVKRELGPAIDRQEIEFHFHATNASGHFSPYAGQCDETTRLLPGSLPNGTATHTSPVKINSGRPDIQGIVDRALESFHLEEGDGATTAILACGPGGMADETRSVVHTALKRGYTRLDYFEEAFGW